ncbi:hypothetical protein [Roseiconus lacunae]|uniref:Uncharacterized protein n=1 Tax=Roseiconus lacunae TaxID=2605694 RepID=A0ABT7PNT2_9BACT|nr:hypothetical protein [Roseiconus lacunae]MDM4018165.1 hypothetical protein [Roseiconus lacunae]
MKPNHIAVAVLAMVITSGCGRAPPPNLTAEQVDQILDTQSTLAQEQAALGRGRDALEEDRRRWAERERHDPIIAVSIQSAAVLVACCLPMVIVALLLASRRLVDIEKPEETLRLVELLAKDSNLPADRLLGKKPASLSRKGA